MKFREFVREVHRRNVWKVAVAYTAAAVVLLEVLTHLFHNFEAPHWVLKVITTLLIAGLPLACLAAWGFELKEGAVRSVPREPRETSPALPAPDTSAPPSIAVLPFEDMGAEHDQQYLGDGIAEELLNALASVQGLNVAARTSSFAFGGKGASMEDIGRTLHVRHVLEGSVRRSGQKLRVTAQLIDVHSGFHLFSQSYDREMQDIFAIQNDIARDIVVALLPRLGIEKGANLVRQGTTNLDAYNLRLQAHRTLTSLSYDNARAGIKQLQEAIKLDPSYGDAWGDLAYTYAYMALWGGDPAPLITRAISAASVARIYSPDNVPALLTLGIQSNWMDHDLAATARIYEQARVVGSDPSVWAVAKAMFFDAPQGHYDEALATLRAAEQKDPLGVTLRYAVVAVNVAAGRIDDALAAASALDKLGSNSSGGWAFSGWAHLKAGNVARAREYLAQLHQIYGPDNWLSVLLGFGIDATTRDHAAAKALLERQLERRAGGQYVSAFVIGEGYKALGDYDKAMAWFTRAVDQHHPHACSFMLIFNRNDPVIGRDPRFLALLKRMGLEGDQSAAG